MLASRQVHGVIPVKSGWHRGSKAKLYSSLTEEDTKRQALNVYRMRLLGAEVISVTSGTGTLKDAVSEAMREWTSRISGTHYCLGSVMGPYPFPTIVRDFQAVISKEIKEQLPGKRRAAFGRVPIKQYLQKFPQWGRFSVPSVTLFLLLPVHPEGCTPAHRT